MCEIDSVLSARTEGPAPSFVIISQRNGPMAARCVMETFINHRKQIISTVLVALMNSRRRRIQNPKNNKIQPEEAEGNNKGARGGGRKMPKKTLICHPRLFFTKTEKEKTAEEQEASDSSAKKDSQTITKLRIRGGDVPPRILQESSSFLVPALIFFF